MSDPEPHRSRSSAPRLGHPELGSGGLLVTGAGGMLGRAVARAARASGRTVMALTHGELDVADAAAVADVLARLRPSAVVNCAAWTDVDGAEADPHGAHAANADGAGNLARAAAATGARLVHVSTDYVFDGSAAHPYRESDATNPRSVYGATKLAGERQVLDAGAHAVVRSSWLFGAGGRNFVDTMIALGADGRREVPVVTDQRGCPTWTGHLAPALLEVLDHGRRGLLHVAGGGQCTWNELAQEVFTQAGLPVRVLAADSVDLRRAAPRPAFSVLVSEHADAPRLPHWREGVAGHLAALGEREGSPSGAVVAAAAPDQASAL